MFDNPGQRCQLSPGFHSGFSRFSLTNDVARLQSPRAPSLPSPHQTRAPRCLSHFAPPPRTSARPPRPRGAGESRSRLGEDKCRLPGTSPTRAPGGPARNRKGRHEASGPVGAVGPLPVHKRHPRPPTPRRMWLRPVQTVCLEVPHPHPPDASSSVLQTLTVRAVPVMRVWGAQPLGGPETLLQRATRGAGAGASAGPARAGGGVVVRHLRSREIPSPQPDDSGGHGKYQTYSLVQRGLQADSGCSSVHVRHLTSLQPSWPQAASKERETGRPPLGAAPSPGRAGGARPVTEAPSGAGCLHGSVFLFKT